MCSTFHSLCELGAECIQAVNEGPFPSKSCHHTPQRDATAFAFSAVEKSQTNNSMVVPGVKEYINVGGLPESSFQIKSEELLPNVKHREALSSLSQIRADSHLFLC